MEAMSGFIAFWFNCTLLCVHVYMYICMYIYIFVYKDQNP